MKKKVYGFNKLDRDVTPVKQKENTYRDAQNVRVIMSKDGESFSLSNAEGNQLTIKLPEITNTGSYFEVRDVDTGGVTIVGYSNPDLSTVPSQTGLKIIGSCYVRDTLVLLATAYNGSNPTGDSNAVLYVFTWDGSTISLKYANAVGVSRQYPMRRVIGRYENENVQKIYFTDNYNQLRILNIADPDIINISKDSLDINPSVEFDDVELDSVISGGSFTQGIVQYAYSLYNDNGSESKISSLSYPFLVDNTLTSSNKSLSLKIDNIDNKYGYIKLYRVYYESIEGTPEISLIADESVTNFFNYTDNGSGLISSVTPDEFVFLGGDPFICKDIAVKDNRLVAANITETPFEVDYDARAFRFNNDVTPQSLIYDKNNNVGSSFTIINGKTYIPILSTDIPGGVASIPEDNDCINPSNSAETNIDFRQARYTHDTTLNNYQDEWYDTFIYQSDGSTIGGTGLNISYEIKPISRFVDNSNKAEVARTSETFKEPQNYNLRSYKRDEIYRFAIRFRNKFGQYSFPKWIGDIRMPNQNTFSINPSSGIMQDLVIDFTVNNIPSDAVDWEILRVERDQANSTILSQVYINSATKTPGNPSRNFSNSYVNTYFPSTLIRTWHDDSFTSGRLRRGSWKDDLDSLGATTTPLYQVGGGTGNYEQFFQVDKLLYMYSPEIIEKDVSLGGEYLNFVGGALTSFIGYERRLDIANAPVNSLENGSILSASNTDIENYNYVNSITNNYKKANGVISDKISRIQIESEIQYTEAQGLKTLSTNVGQDVNLSFESRATVDIGGGTRDMNLDNETSLVCSIRTGNAVDGVSSILSNGGNNLFTAPTGNLEYLILVDYKQTLTNQYGGDSYEAIQRSQYIPIHKGTGSGTFTVRNGDTFVGMWTFTKNSFDDNLVTNGGSFAGNKEVLMLPIESRYNIDMYEFESRDYIASHLDNTYDKASYNNYNKVFHREANTIITTAKPYNFTTNVLYDNRFKISQAKINGEILDSWADFREFDFFDVDATHGAITGIMEYNDQVYFFQPEAVGIMQINPRIQTVSSDGQSIELGTGDLLQDQLYLSTSRGSSHQYSLLKSEYGIYFFDNLTKKFCLVRQNVEPISDLKGMFSWFNTNLTFDNTDNPINFSGVAAGYLKNRNEVYLTFWNDVNTAYTLIYNEYVQGFTSFYTSEPTLYFNLQNRLFSVNKDDEYIYEESVGNRGNFGGIYNPSYVTLTLNPSPLNTCIFDTITYNSQVRLLDVDQPTETLTNIQCFNQYQDSGLQSTDVQRKFREWRVNIPREENTRNRMRGHHAFLKLQFNNTDNKEFVLEDIILNYRDAPASFI